MTKKYEPLIGVRVTLVTLLNEAARLYELARDAEPTSTDEVVRELIKNVCENNARAAAASAFVGLLSASLDAPEPLVVTRQSHPYLHQCLETISHDGGGRAGWKEYVVPGEWAGRADEVNTALGELSTEERGRLCVGDETEQEYVARRSPALRTANDMLEAFFDEDWTRRGRS